MALLQAEPKASFIKSAVCLMSALGPSSSKPVQYWHAGNGEEWGDRVGAGGLLRPADFSTKRTTSLPGVLETQPYSLRRLAVIKSSPLPDPEAQHTLGKGLNTHSSQTRLWIP